MVIGLYMDPPDNALVLAVDEKTQIQALDRTQPELSLMPGRPRRQTTTYTRHGTTCPLAALAVHEGQVDGRCVERLTHRECLAFLKHLYRKYPHRQLHVTCHNLSTHKHAAVTQWVARRRRLTLHFTPTYASWLNQVEIWFHIFSRDVVRAGTWRSKADLVKRIMSYTNTTTRAAPRRSNGLTPASPWRPDICAYDLWDETLAERSCISRCRGRLPWAPRLLSGSCVSWCIPRRVFDPPNIST